jgi:CRP/FNR family transcriptional regulator, nitrogen oxide reductase regulator
MPAPAASTYRELVSKTKLGSMNYAIGVPPDEAGGLPPVKCPLFQDLSPAALERIASLAHERRVAAGGLFVREGEAAEEFFVLTEGRVSISQITPDGHRVMLRLVGPGEAFGAGGAFGESVYLANAEAVEPSAAFAWSSAAMRQLLAAEPGLALNALRFVTTRLIDLQTRYRELMTERVERRLARAVLRLVRDAGHRVDGGVEVDFPVSRQDLADMTGTTLYTVSRLLSVWERRGIIRGRRQQIVLADPRALVAIVEELPDR